MLRDGDSDVKECAKDMVSDAVKTKVSIALFGGGYFMSCYSIASLAPANVVFRSTAVSLFRSNALSHRMTRIHYGNCSGSASACGTPYVNEWHL